MSSGRVDSQYLTGSFSPFGHSISSHSAGRGAVSFSSRCAGRTRRRANREDSGAAAPSRQVIVRHARFGKPNASALTENGRCSLSRRSRFAGRPRRERFFLAGNGALPGAHTVVVGTMPAAYVSPSAVMPARSALLLP